MFEFSFIEKPLIKKLFPEFKNYEIDVFYDSLSDCEGKHVGHYYHEKSCEIFSYYYFTDYENINDFMYLKFDIFETKLQRFYEKICKKLYKKLENEFEFLCSDEQIKQTLIDNEYLYTKEGVQV